MPHSFSRKELYDLVWSEPMLSLSKKYNITGTGLAKACQKANIPVPERGYWNKLKAGKKASKTPLPPRGIGMSDEVSIGKSAWASWHTSDKDALTAEIPPEPIFEEDIETVREKAIALVDKAPLPKNLAKPHLLIAKLLAEEEAKRQRQAEKTYISYRDELAFNSAFEQRRLKILNGLFTCLSACGMKPSLRGSHARELSVTVGDQTLFFKLDSAVAQKQIAHENRGYSFAHRGDKDPMELILTKWHHPSEVLIWRDSNDVRLEDQLREIAVSMIVTGEEHYRIKQINHREYLTERKARAEEDARKRLEEAERQRLEQIARLKKERIDHLLGQAHAMQQAGQIRTYVAAVQIANKGAPAPMTDDELSTWTLWALSQADRLDPVTSGRYRERPAEPA